MSLEPAEILIYLIRVADQLKADLIVAATTRIQIDGERYPVEITQGRAIRADEHEETEDRVQRHDL